MAPVFLTVGGKRYVIMLESEYLKRKANATAAKKPKRRASARK